MKINQNKKALKKLLSCYIYIVLHCLQNPPLLQPENNHRPVNFPLLQHFPETRNVSHGNKPENGNISTFFLLAQGQNTQLGNQR